MPCKLTRRRSRLAEDGVDGPAAADMRPLAAAVLHEVVVVATGVEQGVGKDGQAVEGALLVDALRDLRNGAVVPAEPSRLEAGIRAKGDLEDLTEQSGLVRQPLGTYAVDSEYLPADIPGGPKWINSPHGSITTALIASCV